MSTRTPPGWYPDPGHTGFGPALERWWDGETWTDHTRAAAAAPGQPDFGGPAGFGPQPGFAPRAAPPGKPRGPLIAGVVASVVVVLALVVGAVVVVRGDGEKQAEEHPTSATGSVPQPTPTPTGTDDWRSPPPKELSLAHGVKLPLLEGWKRVEGTYGAVVDTKAQYPCPLKEGRCVRAGAAVYVTTFDGDPQDVATADVAANAAASYAADYYGGIVSREVLATEPVRVAGHDGYFVRWKIDNKADPDAYVQSVAFPHPDGSGQMLVLRMGVDIHPDAPPVAAMDKIVAGVERGAVLDDSQNEAI